MKYILVGIFLIGNEPQATKVDTFDTMYECFDARDKVVELIGRPIINYQAVCVLQGE